MFIGFISFVTGEISMLIEISNLTDLEKTKAGKRVSCSKITVQQKENNRKIDNSVLTISKVGFSFILLADFFAYPKLLNA